MEVKNTNSKCCKKTRVIISVRTRFVTNRNSIGVARKKAQTI